MRRLSCLVLLALLLCPSPGAAKASLRELSDWGVPPAGFAAAGDTLVYFQRDGDAWSLFARQLPDGKARQLASVAPVDPTRIGSIAYDGRWVAWSDDRTGDMEVYALDTTTLAVQRVTARPGGDSDVTLHAGRLAWLHEPDLHWVDLPDGEAGTLALDGLPREPALVPGGLALAVVRNGTRSMVHVADDGTERLLHRQHGSMPREPRTDGVALAWSTPVLWDPDQPGLGVRGTVVQGMPFLEAAVLNLTAGPVDAHGLAVGDGRACWLESDVVRCRAWADGALVTHTVDGEAMALSTAGIVLLRPRDVELGTLALLVEGDGSASLLPAWQAPLALAVLAFAAVARRAR